ncbi:MAG TPA: GNAT family N-acetyltransferase [Spirochaetia bacterium]|nr:GNAT family N-acetyltransferase [Spirochaetia bacterium]
MDRQVEQPSPVMRQEETPLGTVVVEGPASPGHLTGLSMNDCLTNFRPPERQKQALIEIAGLDPGMVFIARNGEEIVGYVTFHEPDSFTRWIKHPRVVELGGIEVSREWRQAHVGGKLIVAAFSFPALEDYIVITTEYCWHWDLRGTNMEMWEYRKMLTNLFGKAGMVMKPTDDPDINEHPANVLMARIGANVSASDALIFEEMLFDEKRFY